MGPDILTDAIKSGEVTVAVMNATNGMEDNKSLVCGFRKASTGEGVLLSAEPNPNGGYTYKGITPDDVAPKKLKEIEAGIKPQTPAVCVPSR